MKGQSDVMKVNGKVFYGDDFEKTSTRVCFTFDQPVDIRPLIEFILDFDMPNCDYSTDDNIVDMSQEEIDKMENHNGG